MGVPTLLGLPYDASSSYLRGSAAAPAVIRAALARPSTNWWSETGCDLSDPNHLADAGDLALPATSDARIAIERGLEALLERGARPLCLGGDHSVTFPIVSVLARRHPHFSVLHVDAHPDLYDVFEGDRYSHACPFARILEARLVTRLVQVGIRTQNGHQRQQAERFGVEQIDMRAWAGGARPTLTGPVYVSIDVDGFDPACAPGVSHREPGGLSTRDVLGLIQALPGPVIGADIVEFNPGQDVGGLTAPLCAKLVKELAACMLANT